MSKEIESNEADSGLSRLARIAEEKAKRLVASRTAFNEQVRLMKKLGILPPGAKPKTKHFNMLAAHHNGMAAASRAVGIQRDLAAFESVGGLGAVIMSILMNPNAKAVERSAALQAAAQLNKSAPQVVSATAVTDNDDDIYVLSDDDIEELERELSK